MGKQLLPALVRARDVRDEMMARKGLLQTAIGLEAYRAECGAYPSSLQMLTDRLDWPVPLDVFSGRAYVYRVEDGRFLLYSLGPDRDDDDGLPMQRQIPIRAGRKGLAGLDDGDWVWIPHGQEEGFRKRVERK